MSERLIVALRAIICINNCQVPAPEDISLLRSWVDPSDRTAADDELARIVIDDEIRIRKEARIHISGATAA